MPKTDRWKLWLISNWVTCILLATVVYAVAYSNLELRAGYGKGNSLGGMTWEQTQGWPFPQRDVKIQYSTDSLALPNFFAPGKLLDSQWIPVGVILNSIVAAALLVSVGFTCARWSNSNTGKAQFRLISLMFFMSVAAIVICSYANGLDGPAVLAGFFEHGPNYFQYVDMPKWHTLFPIAFAMTCFMYVAISNGYHVLRRMHSLKHRPRIAG